MHNLPGSNRRLKILDQGRLTALLKDVVEDRFRGSQNQAARSVGMPQSQLWRITSGKMRSITRGTARSLRSLVPQNRRRQLDMCFLNAGALGSLNKYEVSLQGRVRSITHDEQLEFEALWRHIQNRCGALLESFDSFLVTSAHNPLRRKVAYWETLNPLLQNERSGGVERHWRDLKQSELRAYLGAAIRCQKVLLRRKNEFERAQEESLTSRKSRAPDPNKPLEVLLAEGKDPLDPPLTKSDVVDLWRKVHTPR